MNANDITETLRSILHRLSSPPATAAPLCIPLPSGKGALLARHEDYTLETLEGPKRVKRTHTFEDVRSFADWLLRHADPAKTEILVTESHIEAALSPKTVDGDSVICRMDFHPRFKRWKFLFGNKLEQETIHRFFLSVGVDTANVTDSDGNYLERQADTIARELRKLEIDFAGNFKSEIDPRGFVSFSGGSEETNVKGKLPTSFAINVPIFRGIPLLGIEDGKVTKTHGPALETTRIEVRLFIHARRGDSVKIELDAPTLEVELDEARENCVLYLRHLLGEKWLVGRGRLGLEQVHDTENAAKLFSSAPATDSV